MATINPNIYGKYFQYAASVALNRKEIGVHPEIVSNIERFTNKHNWKGINIHQERIIGGTFEKNNFSVALNVLYEKEMKTCPAYI